jgi:ParB-like chromosome segregation protein Spo0J
MQINAKVSATVEIRTIDSIRSSHSLRESRDISNLAQSIARIGLLNPIVITKDGELIAGKRRLVACKSLKWKEIPCLISPNYSDLEKELAQLSENVIRDNGTKFEQARWLARMKVIYEKLYPETKQGGTPAKAGGGKKRVPKNDKMAPFAKDIAKKIGSSSRSVERKVRLARKLEPLSDKINATQIANSQVDLEKLVQIKDEGLREKVVDTITSHPTLNVEGALKEAKLEARHRQGKIDRETAENNEQKIFKLGGVELVRGDFEEVCETNVAHGAVDLVLFEFPRPGQDTADMCRKLSEVSAALLKPQGSMLVVTNQKDLPGVLKNMRDESLSYSWTLASLVRPTTTKTKPIVESAWIPVVWFTKGEINQEGTQGDLLELTEMGSLAKKFAGVPDFGQPESQDMEKIAIAHQLIQRFSKPDDLVLCPILGSGSAAIAAFNLGRRFFGVESSPEAFNMARESVSKIAINILQEESKLEVSLTPPTDVPAAKITA